MREHKILNYDTYNTNTEYHLYNFWDMLKIIWFVFLIEALCFAQQDLYHFNFLGIHFNHWLLQVRHVTLHDRNILKDKHSRIKVPEKSTDYVMVLDLLGHLKFHCAFSNLVQLEKGFFPEKNALQTLYRNLTSLFHWNSQIWGR